MKFSDLLIGIFLVVLGGGVLAYGLSLPPMPGQSYGAGLFPALLGLCFMGFGMRLAYAGWQERIAIAAPLVTLDDWSRDHKLALNMLLVLALVGAYVLLSERVGFLLLSFAMLTILIWRFGNSLYRSVVVAVIATLFIQISFVSILRVPLPRGLLDRFLW
jgi:putative tricarboxylic transport membrane protein